MLRETCKEKDVPTSVMPDSAVPMSLLADHPDVHFYYLRSGLGKVEVEMH